jgi:hypothetical protein
MWLGTGTCFLLHINRPTPQYQIKYIDSSTYHIDVRGVLNKRYGPTVEPMFMMYISVNMHGVCQVYAYIYTGRLNQ